MGKFKKCVTNGNDIYMYFEIMKQLGSKRVLDIGMFLKRMGAVSRQIMGTAVAEDVYLCGVDFMPDCKVAVYDVIYDKIIETSDYVKMLSGEFQDEHFDLAYMLYTQESLSLQEEKLVWEWLSGHVKQVVVDKGSLVRNCEFIKQYSYRELTVDNDSYGLIIF